MSEPPHAARKPSPYVGPRAIREKEPIFGREMEAQALLGRLLSAGVMLLHAPSGAGKTSLIQASLVPRCRDDENMQVCASMGPPFSALRVNLPPPADLPIANRYVFSVVNALVGGSVDRHDAAGMTIEEALTLFADDADTRQLVVVDQLEEALTLDPNDQSGQAELFRQLGNALRSDRRWALLAIRDDYLGGLDRYRRFFPNELRATFHLDFLHADAAACAVQGPAGEAGVTFTDEAAKRLVEDLRRVRAAPVTSPAAPEEMSADLLGAEPRLYPYVEPVLLQVICNNLWRILSKTHLAQFREIAESDLDEVRPYHRPLASYYQAVVRKAAAGDPVVERGLRDWIEGRLITPQHTRRPTTSRPPFDDSDEVVERLADRYLVRKDRRTGGDYWELAHDLLVEPIVDDNRKWRIKNLQPWQVVADQWHRSDRPSSLLLSGPELHLALASAAEITPSALEHVFLDESRNNEDEEMHRRRMEAEIQVFRYRESTYRWALFCSLALNVVLFVIVLVRMVA